MKDKNREGNGVVYMLPSPLGIGAPHTIAHFVLGAYRDVDVLLSERPKTTRAYLKELSLEVEMKKYEYYTVSKHTKELEIREYLMHALKGKNIGVLSEAGLPGVADPGGLVVRLAYGLGLRVVPMVGPSSIFLGLMASGLNGQNFAFRGYLPIKKPDHAKMFKIMESRIRRENETQIFIETPYRNDALYQSLINNMPKDFYLCVAMDLTQKNEWIMTQSVLDWTSGQKLELNGRQVIFLLGG